MSAMRENNTDVTASGEMENGDKLEKENSLKIASNNNDDQIAKNHNDQISPDVDKQSQLSVWRNCSPVAEDRQTFELLTKFSSSILDPL